MIYTKENNKIIIKDFSSFLPRDIFECGQVFSYKKIDENKYVVFSLDKKAEVYLDNNNYIIESIDIDYFINFFDLDTNYELIKHQLMKYDFMAKSIEYGKGIRILKQDLLETIVSFVISANNNIKRIQKSIYYIRENLGKKIQDYYSFPSLETLKKCDEDFFIKAGLGYRAKQLTKLLIQINEKNLEESKAYDTEKLKAWLISLSGIGPKVADCILLFGYNRYNVFPVDTWIEKVFNDYFYKLEDRKKIREILIETFGNLSGYAQQYLFYFKRENNKKN